MIETFIKKTILAALFIAVFYVCGLVLAVNYIPELALNANYRKGGTGHLHSRIQDLKQYGEVDALFIGSSHAYRGFDPRIFQQSGIRAFTLGSSAQTPMQTELLVHRYLDRLKPKMVVFDVFPKVMQSDGVESALDLIANDSIGLDTLGMASRINHLKVWNTLAYGAYRELFGLDQDFVEKRRRDDDTYIEGGFVEKAISYYDSSTDFQSENWILKENQIEAFERILIMLKERDIPVMLVMVPVAGDYYSAHLNNEEISAYLGDLCEKRDLCEAFHDFNILLKLDSGKHFYDYHHLNQDGVRVFNDDLISRMKKHLPAT